MKLPNYNHSELKLRTSGAKTSPLHTPSVSFFTLLLEVNKNILKEHVTTNRHNVHCITQQFIFSNWLLIRISSGPLSTVPADCS